MTQRQRSQRCSHTPRIAEVCLQPPEAGRGRRDPPLHSFNSRFTHQGRSWTTRGPDDFSLWTRKERGKGKASRLEAARRHPRLSLPCRTLLPEGRHHEEEEHVRMFCKEGGPQQ